MSLLVSALGTAAAVAAPITYNINQAIGQGSVVGTIQTDGTTGVLSEGNITGWTLALNGVGASYSISTANSVVRVVGTDLTATATALSFNYSGADDGYLLFQDGLNSGTQYYCDATSSATCLQGASVVPQRYTDPSAQIVPMSGLRQIATVPVATPEPASLALLGAGLAGAGLLRRRRRAS